MKTKILKLLPLSVAALLLLACNSTSSSSSTTPAVSSSTPTSSSASTPSSSSEAPVSSSEAPVSSSEAPVSSSEVPVSSSEAPAPSSSSSEAEVPALVETLAGSTYTAAETAFTTDHFVGYNVKTDGSTINTSGTSEVDKKTIKVIATAPGYLEFANLRTGSSGDTRNLYLAQMDSTNPTVVSRYIARQICDYNPENSNKPINYDPVFSIPAAGTYYLMSNAAVKFESVSLYSYSEKTDVVDGIDETMPTGALFDAHYAAPTATDYTEAHAFGTSLTANVGAEVRFHGKIVNDTDSSITYYNSLYLEANDSFTYTADGAGTLTVTALGRNSDKTTVTTLTGADAAGTAVTTDTETPFNVKGGASETALSQQFSLDAAGSYTFTADGVLAIYEISWTALE